MRKENLISFKDLRTVKSDGYNEFIPELKIVSEKLTVESSERSIHLKTIAKVKTIIIDDIKYFDLEEYKKIMLFTSNYILKCFK